jgi:transcriptional regulator with XRE-family HTH domain
MVADGLREDRVREALARAGKSQQWLAEHTGISKQALGQGLSRGSMRLGNAVRLARALNCSLDWLVGLDSDAARIGEAVAALPDAQQQLTLDFLLYQIDRAPETLMAGEKAAHYTTMIERIKQDRETR